MSWFTNDFNAFFKDLVKNNNKEWFDANRKRCETSLKNPFEAFVAEAIQRVAKHDRTITIAPKKAIFRINKDVRFSQDKTPCKLEASALVAAAGRKDHNAPPALGCAGCPLLPAAGFQPTDARTTGWKPVPHELPQTP